MSDSVTRDLLNHAQQRAVDALLAGGDVAAAAAAAGVTDRTIQRWRKEPAFLAALQMAQDAALDRTAGALVAASGAAVALLRRVVEDDAAQMSHRLRAAGTLLDATLRWHELRSISQRLAQLEQQVGFSGGGG